IRKVDVSTNGTARSSGLAAPSRRSFVSRSSLNRSARTRGPRDRLRSFPGAAPSSSGSEALADPFPNVLLRDRMRVEIDVGWTLVRFEAEVISVFNSLGGDIRERESGEEPAVLDRLNGVILTVDPSDHNMVAG